MQKKNSYTVRYSKKALLQYRKAATWYGEKSFLAEENFIIAVEYRIRLIKTDPHRYRNIYKHFYEIATKKYPYLLIYLVDEKLKEIIISSIHHHKQNPKRKFRR